MILILSSNVSDIRAENVSPTDQKTSLDFFLVLSVEFDISIQNFVTVKGIYIRETPRIQYSHRGAETVQNVVFFPFESIYFPRIKNHRKNYLYWKIGSYFRFNIFKFAIGFIFLV